MKCMNETALVAGQRSSPTDEPTLLAAPSGHTTYGAQAQLSSAPPKQTAYVSGPQQKSAPAQSTKSAATSGGTQIGIGLVICMMGIILTIISYSTASSGGTYFIFWGLVLVGIINIVAGLARLSGSKWLINTKEQWLNEGLAQRKAGRYQEAFADYDRAIALDPKFALAYNSRGFVYYNLKENEKALADYDRAIALDPKLAPAYNNRGLAYYNLKENQKALTDYDSAIALDPKLAPAYNNRGLVYRDLKQYDKSLADYNEALTFDPKFALAYNNRGLAYYNLKENQKPLADYDSAIALDPKFAIAHYNAGKALQAMGRTDTAQQAFATARQLGYMGSDTNLVDR